MAITSLSHPLRVEVILPFLLVFTLVFAILQKTKILGDGKKQIDALVALVIGLIVVSFGYTTGIIISLIPFLAIAAVIILIFMLLYGMTFEAGGFKLHKSVQVSIGILAAIGVIIVTMFATGAWNFVLDVFNSGGDFTLIITNLVFLVIIIVALVVAMFGGKGGGDKKKE